MKIKIFEKFDYILFFCVAILLGLSISFIYSSGINSEGILVSKEYIKQIIWAVCGLIIMGIVAVLDYRKIYRYAPFLFGAAMLMLVYTMLFGKYVNGARSWIGIGELGI